jgi:hypothetical protein
MDQRWIAGLSSDARDAATSVYLEKIKLSEKHERAVVRCKYCGIVFSPPDDRIGIGFYCPPAEHAGIDPDTLDRWHPPRPRFTPPSD